MQTGIGNPPPWMLNLFNLGNYKFSSQAAGRPSTFYFSDLVGNRGRFRRAHPLGPELVFQGRCKRIFISPVLMNKIALLSEHTIADKDDEDAFHRERYTKIFNIIPMIQKGDPDGIYKGKASLVIKEGWRLFDTDDNLVHCSSGTIILNDPEATNFFNNGGQATIQNYQGQWSIW